MFGTRLFEKTVAEINLIFEEDRRIENIMKKTLALSAVLILGALGAACDSATTPNANVNKTMNAANTAMNAANTAMNAANNAMNAANTAMNTANNAMKDDKMMDKNSNMKMDDKMKDDKMSNSNMKMDDKMKDDKMANSNMKKP